MKKAGQLLTLRPNPLRPGRWYGRECTAVTIGGRRHMTQSGTYTLFPRRMPQPSTSRYPWISSPDRLLWAALPVWREISLPKWLSRQSIRTLRNCMVNAMGSKQFSPIFSHQRSTLDRRRYRVWRLRKSIRRSECGWRQGPVAIQSRRPDKHGSGYLRGGWHAIHRSRRGQCTLFVQPAARCDNL